MIFERCRLVSDAHVPPGPANIFAMRSASASAASTRVADFFASMGQSTRAGGVIAADSPAGGIAGSTDFVMGAGVGARETIAGAADVFALLEWLEEQRDGFTDKLIHRQAFGIRGEPHQRIQDERMRQ